MSSLTRKVNRDFISVHQSFRKALTWHYFVEFMKNTPWWNSELMLWMTLEVHSNLMMAEGFYTTLMCSCCSRNTKKIKHVKIANELPVFFKLMTRCLIAPCHCFHKCWLQQNRWDLFECAPLLLTKHAKLKHNYPSPFCINSIWSKYHHDPKHNINIIINKIL